MVDREIWNGYVTIGLLAEVGAEMTVDLNPEATALVRSAYGVERALVLDREYGGGPKIELLDELNRVGLVTKLGVLEAGLEGKETQHHVYVLSENGQAVMDSALNAYRGKVSRLEAEVSPN